MRWGTWGDDATLFISCLWPPVPPCVAQWRSSRGNVIAGHVPRATWCQRHLFWLITKRWRFPGKICQFSSFQCWTFFVFLCIFWNGKPVSFLTNVMSVGVKFRLFAPQVSLCLWWRQCYGTVEVQAPACRSRALGRGWSGSRPGRFAVVKEPWIQFCRGWVVYRTSLNQWRTTCECCRCLESNRGSSVVQSPYWLSCAGCLCTRLCGMELWQRAWCLALGERLVLFGVHTSLTANVAVTCSQFS